MRAKEGISPYFVYCLARDKAFREFAIKSMTGTSGRQRAQVDMLESFAVPQWNKSDMEAFHAFAHSAFQKIKSMFKNFIRQRGLND
jgi:type I restriction enzyme S subunit